MSCAQASAGAVVASMHGQAPRVAYLLWAPAASRGVGGVLKPCTWRLRLRLRHSLPDELMQLEPAQRAGCARTGAVALPCVRLLSIQAGTACLAQHSPWQGQQPALQEPASAQTSFWPAHSLRGSLGLVPRHLHKQTSLSPRASRRKALGLHRHHTSGVGLRSRKWSLPVRDNCPAGLHQHTWQLELCRG